MKANVGTIDRTLRIIAGVGIIGAGIYYGSWWGLVGIIPLMTGFSRFCPAYLPIKMSTTCDKKTAEET